MAANRQQKGCARQEIGKKTARLVASDMIDGHRRWIGRQVTVVVTVGLAVEMTVGRAGDALADAS
jgi:hypothetical protein